MNTLPFRRVVLIGPSGSGKSTVARLLAARLGWAAIDTDEMVVREAGRDAATIFAEDGEAAFRERERAAVREACSRDHVVVAAGGGAPLDPENAARLWDDSFVVGLQARPETAMARLDATDEARPLLTGDRPLTRIEAQQRERAAVYALADWTTRTDGLSPERIAMEIERAAREHAAELVASRGAEVGPPDPMIAYGVRTATAHYPIVVGWDILDSLGERMRDMGMAGPAYIISDVTVQAEHGIRARESLSRAGIDADVYAVPPGETSKSLHRAASVYDWLVARRAERGHVIVALGGGVIGDLAGFVAATFLRGMPLVLVPTSLLAMVDASIGGKVAVDHRDGKNLIGAFYQPRLVFDDVALLRTLQPRELTAGWAEVAKHAFIMDPELLAMLEERAEDVAALLPDFATRIVARNVALKGRVVSEDERETTGVRMTLNYGHTIGHAIETATAYGQYLHGEAVAIGMMGAAKISAGLGLLDPSVVSRQEALLRRLGLPLRAPGVDPRRVRAAMAVDKKVRGKAIRWVLLEGVGRTVIRDDVPDDLVRNVVDELTAQ